MKNKRKIFFTIITPIIGVIVLNSLYFLMLRFTKENSHQITYLSLIPLYLALLTFSISLIIDNAIIPLVTNRKGTVIITYLKIIANGTYVIGIIISIYWGIFLFSKENVFGFINTNYSHFICFTFTSIFLLIFPLHPNLFMQYPIKGEKNLAQVKQTCIDINRFTVFCFYFVFILTNIKNDMKNSDDIIIQLFSIYIGFDRMYSVIRSNRHIYKREFVKGYLYYRRISFNNQIAS